jgi:hypothetical protein
MTLDEATDYATQNLDAGGCITIDIQSDAAKVYASNLNGDFREFDGADMGLAEQVRGCVAWCNSFTRSSDDEPMALKPCPCGEVPTKLFITDVANGSAFAYGNCCGEWPISFRTDARPKDSMECMKRAFRAWNRAPRAIPAAES